MKDIIFFSHNQKKINEIKHIFKQSRINVYGLSSFKKIKEPKEDGKTFFDNAKIKSKFGQKIFKKPCFSDDSGFCVDALNNKPGIKSKRFFDKFLSKKQAFDFIIKAAKNKNNYKASFISVISLTLDENHHVSFFGKVEGKIALKPKGSNGFGYDPIFIPHHHKKTFAEMSLHEKNKISHRKIALLKLKNFLF